MKKIAYSGSHGTGKTFSVLDLAKEYKISSPNSSVGIIQEVARHCPLPINTESTDESELWILVEQMRLEIDYSTKYNIIICDRSVVDTIAYSRVRGHKYASGMLNLISKYIDTYDKIIFKTIQNNNYQVDDGVRDMGHQFREDVESELIRIYEALLCAGAKFEIEYV